MHPLSEEEWRHLQSMQIPGLVHLIRRHLGLRRRVFYTDGGAQRLGSEVSPLLSFGDLAQFLKIRPVGHPPLLSPSLLRK